MKKLLYLLLLLPVALSAQNNWKNIQISPANPKAGETIQITYDLPNSPFRDAESLEATAYDYTEKTPDSREVSIRSEGNKLVATFTTGPKALVATFAFHSGEKWDNNMGEGYFISLTGPDGKAIAESKAAQAVFYRAYGGLMELNAKPAMANALLDEAFKADASFRNKYLISYTSNLMNIKKGEAGKPEVIALLDEIVANPKTTEKDLTSTIRMYEYLHEMDKANGVKDKVRTNFPKGAFIQQERRATIGGQPDAATREKMVEQYASDFPPQTDDDRNLIDNLWSSLAQRYADQKNWDKFKELTAKMTAAKRAYTYNNVAWNLAETGEEVGWAAIFGRDATQWAQKEMLAPSVPKPAMYTLSAWEENRKDVFTQYADTYAYVLDKTSESAKAAELQAKVVDITKGKNDEMNERYTLYLERAKSPELRYVLEGFIAKGHASGKMKEQFKKLYLGEDKTEKGYTDYMSQLGSAAKALKQKELADQMIDEAAPKFTLKNLDGTAVSLESLKGKVVIIDFWATWCGPCKASFPGMQMAQNQYKDDKNVVFLFVDTWERVAADEKAKTAGDFIKSKSYPFNVLLDLDDSVVASYGVTGIPTKFIVDKNGKIRFKSIGFDGSSEGLAEEMSLMIDLAKAQ